MALLVLITINVHFEISANILIFFCQFHRQKLFFLFYRFSSCLRKCLREMRKMKAYKTAVLSVEEEGKCDESWWQYLEVWANVLIINKFSAQSKIVRYPSNIFAFRDDISIETYFFLFVSIHFPLNLSHTSLGSHLNHPKNICCFFCKKTRYLRLVQWQTITNIR